MATSAVVPEVVIQNTDQMDVQMEPVEDPIAMDTFALDSEVFDESLRTDEYGRILRERVEISPMTSVMPVSPEPVANVLPEPVTDIPLSADIQTLAVDVHMDDPAQPELESDRSPVGSMRPSNSRHLFEVSEHRTGRGKGAILRVENNRFVR